MRGHFSNECIHSGRQVDRDERGYMSPQEVLGDVNMFGHSQLTRAVGDRAYEGPTPCNFDSQCHNHDNDTILPKCILSKSSLMVSSNNQESDSIGLTTSCLSPTDITPPLMGTDAPPTYPASTPPDSLSLVGSIKKNNIMGPAIQMELSREKSPSRLIPGTPNCTRMALRESFVYTRHRVDTAWVNIDGGWGNRTST